MMTRAAALVGAILLASCSVGSCPCRTAAPPEEVKMKQAFSPAGDPHPGEIVHEDRVTGRTWTVRASEVPSTIAWVEVEGRFEPVVRIEITGTPDQRRITKYGRDGQMLESTVQAPPIPPRP